MKIYFTDVFNVDRDALRQYGAFNVSLVNDLPLFVDPFLLFNSSDGNYQNLHADIIRYMRFLKEVSLAGELSKPLVKSWFTFPEVVQNWLGFSQKGNRGHGLGDKFAKDLHKNFHSVFTNFGDETVTRSSHIEKLCLIGRGVGRDNISDFSTNLIKHFLAEYTQAFALEHVASRFRDRFAVEKVKFNYETRTWTPREYELPRFQDDFVLLTPRNILTKDESWINRPDLLDRLQGIADSMPDTVLRAHVNEYLMRVLPSDPKATRKQIHEAISRVIERYPAILDYYVREREAEGNRAPSIARSRVAEVETRFVENVSAVAELLAAAGFYKVSGNTYDEARARLLFLKNVIEHKGGYRYFYLKGKPLEREEDSRLFFHLTWYGTSADLSREVNDGRGPADFKVSHGAHDKTIVEFKLANNKKLEQNLARQTEAYEAASDATHPSLKAIVYFSASQLSRVKGILRRLGVTNSPHIILIDARNDNKPSGSRA